MNTETPKAIKSNEEILEGRNFFCDPETVEIIYSMMDEARRDTAEEKDKEIKRLKGLIKTAHNLATCDLPDDIQTDLWNAFRFSHNL